MKFKINAQQFAIALSKVSRAIQSRPATPVLACVLLEADAETDRVKLTTFDLSLAIETNITTPVSQSGRVAVPFSLLSSIISKLPDEIELSTRNLEVLVKAGRIKSKIQALDAEEYPDIPQVKEESLVLPSSLLWGAIRSVVFAASKDTFRGILQGVRFESNGETLEIAATDGHRLATYTAPYAGPKAEKTIPASALEALTGLIANSETIQLAANNFCVDLSAESGTVTSRLLEGNYPQYRLLFPKSFAATCRVSRQALIAALERASILVANSTKTVTASIASDELIVSSKAEANEISAALSADLQGDPISLRFNVTYLLQSLKAIPAEEVIIHTNSPTTPVVIKGVDDEYRAHLIMPINKVES